MNKNNKQLVNAWCMYDWANSVYSLVIISTIFPVYYSAVAVNAQKGDVISFLGLELKNSVLYSYAVSFAFLVVALLSPILTAIADYSGNKKRFMQFFCYLGALSCAVLFFFTTDTLSLGIGAFVLAGIGFSGSIVFYNSYLPEIATEDQFDRISAKGFSLGYIGSVLHLIVNLLLIMKPEWFGGISSGLASRIAFLTTGLWWFAFAQYTFYYLPNNVYHKKAKGNWLLNGFQKLKGIVVDLKVQPLLKRFLLSFFFYNMGVQTVMYLATLFGDKELHLPAENLILTILILQLVAIPGAYAFAKLSARYGNIMALVVAVVIWIGICAGAYYVTNGNEFYALAAVVGLVMGGVQSLSRATYSKLIPENTHDHASYFSFYDVVEKLSIVLGTASYGLAEQLTGSMRNSVLVIALFFVIGLIILSSIPSRKVYVIHK